MISLMNVDDVINKKINSAYNVIIFCSFQNMHLKNICAFSLKNNACKHAIFLWRNFLMIHINVTTFLIWTYNGVSKYTFTYEGISFSVKNIVILLIIR